MLIVFNPFNQPAVGGQVTVNLIGKPVYPRATIMRFIKYGVYTINEVENQSSLVPTYLLSLQERYSGSPTTVPAGTIAYLSEEDLTVGSLPYSSTRFLDLRGPDYQLIPLDGDITFATQHHFPGRAITVRVRNMDGMSSRNLSFPASWIFIGSAGRPTTIGPSKTGILSVTSLGTSDGDVIAAWGVQPG